MCIWRVLRYFFIVPTKIYYVEKTTSYLLFHEISNKRIVAIIMVTVIFKQIHGYSTFSWVVMNLKIMLKNIKQTNKKHIPYIQGNGSLLGQQLFLEKNS